MTDQGYAAAPGRKPGCGMSAKDHPAIAGVVQNQLEVS